MLQFLNEQEAVIKKSEAAIAELNEAKNNLENQIIEMVIFKKKNVNCLLTFYLSELNH